MLTKKILKSILSVKQTAIDDINIQPDGSFSIRVHPAKGAQCRCGRKCPCYDKGRGIRSWRTCDWNNHKVFLMAEAPRVICPLHGVVTAHVPWARHNSRFTKVIWAHAGHGKTIFAKFFRLLTKEQLAGIRLVSGDGAKWIQGCIDDYCPEAERCIDPFHVVQWATEVLDEVRRAAWRNALKDAKDKSPKKRGCPRKDAPKEDTAAKDFKRSRFTLGKAPEHPTPKQQAQLAFMPRRTNGCTGPIC